MASQIHSALGALAALAIAATPAIGQKQYGPGATDTEIRIGTTTPYSGPASAYSAGAVSTAAYFAMVNDHGGVNGRRINFISLDDAYSPPKTVEQIRRLIESDEVLFLVNPVGTATNMAVLKYINQKKVPHLFVGSGATVFNDPEHFPWTMSWTPHYASESEIYAKYLLSVKPDAKVAIISQNDDLGRDYLQGFRRGLGAKASSMIVSALTYITSDPTLTPHKALELTRGHWTVENNLHWVLDVVFGEDRSRIRSRRAAENFGALRRLALSLLTAAPPPKKGMSLKRRRHYCAHSHDYLQTVLARV